MATARLKTHKDIAAWQQVSVRTVESWAARRGWPAKRPSGYFSRRDLSAFLKAEGLGEFNESRNPAPGPDGLTLREVTTRKIQAQAERLQVTNERLRELQRKELAGIVFRADAEAEIGRQRDVVQRVAGDCARRLAAAMDGLPSDQAGWDAQRSEVMAIVGGLKHDLHAAMGALPSE